MSNVKIQGNSSGTGTLTIAAPNTNSDFTLNLPAFSGTIPTLASVTNNGVAYVNASGQTTSGSALTFDGTNLGIGTSSPSQKVHASSSGDTYIQISRTASGSEANLLLGSESGSNVIYSRNATTGNAPLLFSTGTTERMRIDSSGNLLVNQTSSIDGKLQVKTTAATWGIAIDSTTATTQYFQRFTYNQTQIGYISGNNTSTSYVTSSDYRLKEDVQPLTGALAKVAALKPVTYKWKVDGSNGEGFIAHELAEVCPQAVTGEKDATRIEQYEISPAVPATYDEDGNELTPAVEAVMGELEVPIYQGIDTSFLAGLYAAAIQELKAELDTVKSELQTLKGA